MKDKTSFKRTALITGASSGIGKTIAQEFAKAGYVVFVHFNKSYKEAEKTKSSILKEGGVAYTIKADITKEVDVQNLFVQIEKKVKHLDVLVNNAGIYKPQMLESHNSQIWDEILTTNLKGKLLCIKHAIPYLKKASSPIIINIASRSCQEPMEESAAYCCSAAAIEMLTQVSALELAKYKIRVNTISPGLTKTRMTTKYDTDKDFQLYAKLNPLGRVGKTEDIANVALFLASDKASFINGENIHVSGGILLT